MRLILWLVRALLFFTLFAFALNNQHEAAMRWFFGHEWRAPMVFVVLAAFTAGCVFGVLAMLPSWWKHRRVAHRHQRDLPAEAQPTGTTSGNSLPLPEHPPRDGL
jgi:lipopolysaccharide assembly protein A